MIQCDSRDSNSDFSLRIRMSPVPLHRQLQHLPHQPDAAQPDPPRRALVTARRLQVAEETLSPQLPDLRGGVLPPRHHRSGHRRTPGWQNQNRFFFLLRSSLFSASRPRVIASERREAGEDGTGAGNASAGVAAAGAAAPGAGGGTQLAAAQQR